MLHVSNIILIIFKYVYFLRNPMLPETDFILKQFEVLTMLSSSRHNPLTYRYTLKGRDNSYKLQTRKFWVEMRKKFFTMAVVKHWNRTQRGLRNPPPSLEVFRTATYSDFAV